MLRTCGASGAVRALEARKGPISKAGEVKSADDVDEVLVQKRCTSGLRDYVVHDCSPELSREPPWQMPHVPWAVELQVAGYLTWRDSSVRPLIGGQKRGVQPERSRLQVN